MYICIVSLWNSPSHFLPPSSPYSMSKISTSFPTLNILLSFSTSLQLGVRLDDVVQRHILDILRDSLADRPNEANRTENEVRYKLIVDPSEDDSLVRLLFTFGVLDRQSTRVYVCSDFPGDTHLQKVLILKSLLATYVVTTFVCAYCIFFLFSCPTL